MKRNMQNKPKKVKCKICHREISLYSLSTHIKWSHDITIEEYVKKYGEFRKQNKKKNVRKIKKIQCKICNKYYSIAGIYTHFRDTHNITTEKYIKKYGEYRPKYIDYNERAEKNKIECLICHKFFGSEKLLTYHIRLEHKIKKIDYVRHYIFEDQEQYCKCGCENKVKIYTHYPYRSQFVSGHNKNITKKIL